MHEGQISSVQYIELIGGNAGGRLIAVPMTDGSPVREWHVIYREHPRLGRLADDYRLERRRVRGREFIVGQFTCTRPA